MTMHTVMTTNNGYDSILLVDDNDMVLSAWQATSETVADYLKDTDASDWHVGEWPNGFAPQDADSDDEEEEVHTIAAYGEECGRDGVITDQSRLEFWARD